MCQEELPQSISPPRLPFFPSPLLVSLTPQTGLGTWTPGSPQLQGEEENQELLFEKPETHGGVWSWEKDSEPPASLATAWGPNSPAPKFGQKQG